MDLQFQVAQGRVLDVKELRVDGVPVRPSAGSSYLYTHNLTLTEPPSESQLRFNAAAPYTAVTRVWARYHTVDGEDVGRVLLVTVKAGSVLYVQDRDDAARNVSFTVTAAPVDKATYVEFVVTFRSAESALLAQQVRLYTVA
jgi:hypothetical protein